MKKIKLKAMILILALVICSGVAGLAVYGDETIRNSMTVSPTTQRIILEPGESYTNYIQITNANASTRDLSYGVMVGSFSQYGSGDSKDDYDRIDYVAKSSYNQMMDWITFDKTSGTVMPNETDTVAYTINVPKDAPAGGQYATIIVRDDTDANIKSSGNDNGGESSASIIEARQFASIIYAEVAGGTREEGQITDNSMPSFMLNGPLAAISMVRNNGNVHTDASYTLQVWPLFSDEEICTNEENPDTSLILPETSRYHEQSCELPAVGIFRAKQVVKIFGETSIVEKTVIVCPIWLMFIIIFVIIVIVIWIVMRIRTKGKARKGTGASE